MSMTGILYILFFYAAGELLSRLLGGFVSGSVIGMLLLFIALISGIADPEKIRPAARFLVNNMAMFFIPLGVGLMCSYRIIAANIWAILAASIASTVIVIATVGWLQQKIGNRI